MKILREIVSRNLSTSCIICLYNNASNKNSLKKLHLKLNKECDLYYRLFKVLYVAKKLKILFQLFMCLQNNIDVSILSLRKKSTLIKGSVIKRMIIKRIYLVVRYSAQSYT